VVCQRRVKPWGKLGKVEICPLCSFNEVLSLSGGWAPRIEAEEWGLRENDHGKQ